MKPSLTFPSPAQFAGLLALFIGATSLQAAVPVASEEPDEYAAPRISDPFEPLNRAVFKFNDGFYVYILRPFAHGYEHVVPSTIRRGFGNFFDNLKFPVRFVSCVLQAKPKRAAQETGKFLLNSTVGVAGLRRVSDSFPELAAVPSEDVGLTFGVWGISEGPYQVLPFLGPSSVRDTVGLAGNFALNPLNWPVTRRAVHDRGSAHALLVVDLLNSSPDMIRTYDDFKKSAVDPYIAVRSGYLQYRAAAVKK